MKRFENNKLFILGMVCLVISLCLFFLCLYVLPNFIWGLRYDMPTFIFNLLVKYQDDYHYTSARSKLIVWLILVIPCIITGIISYFIARYLDNKVYGVELESPEEQEKIHEHIQEEIKESATLSGKIFILMIVIVAALFFLHFLITI